MNAPFAPRRRAPIAALLRFALRDLRGGLAGLRIVLLCVALGVAAIVGVNSLARALEDGLARDGRTILGGDASFSLMHRELAPDERAYPSSSRRTLDRRDLARDGAQRRRRRDAGRSQGGRRDLARPRRGDFRTGDDAGRRRSRPTATRSARRSNRR